MSEAPTPLPPPTVCTCAKVRKAARRVSQIYDKHLEPFGFTIGQFGLLIHLRAHDGVSIGHLAERLVMDPTSLTRTLKPLERQGYVVSRVDPQDRRARLLSLTAEGRQALRAARPGWEQAQRLVEATIGRDETQVLHAALDGALARLGA